MAKVIPKVISDPDGDVISIQGWLRRFRGFMTTLLIGLATAFAAAFAALIVAAVAAAPAGMPKADLLRVYSDLVRLLVSLSKDRRIARPVRWRLLVALIYNVQPINLIPNFIPVVGLADNVVVTAWAVRSAIRRSGAEVVLGHWPGSPASFTLLCRLCHLQVPPELSAGDDVEPSGTYDRLNRQERDVAGLR